MSVTEGADIRGSLTSSSSLFTQRKSWCCLPHAASGIGAQQATTAQSHLVLEYTALKSSALSLFGFWRLPCISLLARLEHVLWLSLFSGAWLNPGLLAGPSWLSGHPVQALLQSSFLSLLLELPEFGLAVSFPSQTTLSNLQASEIASVQVYWSSFWFSPFHPLISLYLSC